MIEGKDWFQHWSRVEQIPSYDRDQLLRQVGKTAFGKPVDYGQVEIIVQQITHALDLQQDDTVLEVGCGNGLITAELAKRCKAIYAFDYSVPLIDTARKLNARPNVTYANGSAEERMSYLHVPLITTKVISYEMLQHLSLEQARAFIANLNNMHEQLRIFLGSIPDQEKIRKFYDTEERWQYYLANVKEHKEQIGHWWKKSALKKIAIDAGFAVTFMEQDSRLYTSHYRFNALLVK